MNRLLIILSIFLSTQVHALEARFKPALSKTTKALLKVPTLKTYRKRISSKIRRKIKISKTTWTIIGSSTALLKDKKIGTTPIKRMNIRFLGGKMRPDALYNFNTRETSGKVGIQWSY